MGVNLMTKQEFISLPHRKWDEEVLCDSIIIIPGSGKKNELHDSGYRCMDFVAVKKGKPTCLLSGCSDVIHINGIGGFGAWEVGTGFPKQIAPISWNIDCLPKSGLMRLFLVSTSHIISCKPALSSFEIIAIKGKI